MKCIIDSIYKYPMIWTFFLAFLLSNLSILSMIIRYNSNLSQGADLDQIFLFLSNPMLNNLLNISYLFYLSFIIVAAYKLYKWIKRVGLLAPIKSDSDTSET